MGVAVVGASAGGVEALKHLASCLPVDLGCPVVVVLHVSSVGTSVLPAILDRAGPNTATAAVDGDLLLPGHLYVAPPNRHVLVTPGGLRLSDGPRENGHRPAVDPTMRSAVQTYGARTVGIVLSGTRDDGTAGLAAIKEGGGRVLIQDPDEALYSGMPRNAMAGVAHDGVLTIVEIARWLVRAAGGVESPGAARGDAMRRLTTYTGGGPSDHGTRFSCPDCGGNLFEISEGGVLRLQCAVGHVYSPESFAEEQGHELERALWTATRTLDDRAVLFDRMAVRARANGHATSADGFERQAHAAREHATVIRRSIQRFDDTTLHVPDGDGAAR